ncbi:helix-turn-helix transcriptional regulator [Myxococcaceae bacterium JPH2]|nr:helix-turn-helix transcriptional regulator [Myxococcaceae bacterium JPH2]
MARPADPHAREALIAAARAEFARKGLKGARIEDITAACGLSKGAFYLHFDTKEALFGELVTAFQSSMGDMSTRRVEGMQRFHREEGHPTVQDVATRSPLYLRFIQAESALDLELLELLWAYRDVVAVLIRGSQGTEFESSLWGLVDQEVARISREYRNMQPPCVADSGHDPELFGSFIVGAYLLLAKQMGHMRRKPDLAVWASSVQRLIHEGAAPREPLPASPPALPAAARVPSRKPSSRRPQARASTRRSPRKRS